MERHVLGAASTFPATYAPHGRPARPGRPLGRPFDRQPPGERSGTRPAAGEMIEEAMVREAEGDPGARPLLTDRPESVAGAA